MFRARFSRIRTEDKKPRTKRGLEEVNGRFLRSHA
jgi:hypothetical protein